MPFHKPRGIWSKVSFETNSPRGPHLDSTVLASQILTNMDKPILAPCCIKHGSYMDRLAESRGLVDWYRMQALHACAKICYVHFACQSWPIANSTSSTLPFLGSMRSQKQTPTSSGLTPEKHWETNQTMQPMHPGASGSQTAHKGSHLPPSQPGSHLHPHFADLEIAQSGGSIYMYLSSTPKWHVAQYWNAFPDISCIFLCRPGG